MSERGTTLQAQIRGSLGWGALLLFCVMTAVVLNPSRSFAGEEGGGEGGKEQVAGPAFVRLKPITFSVIGPDNRITRQVGVLLQLQLVSGKTPQQLEQFQRQIEDRFLLTLTELWDSHPPGAPPIRAEEIKDQLLKAASAVTGPGLVDAVLIQELSERGR